MVDLYLDHGKFSTQLQEHAVQRTCPLRATKSAFTIRNIIDFIVHLRYHLIPTISITSCTILKSKNEPRCLKRLEAAFIFFMQSCIKRHSLVVTRKEKASLWSGPGASHCHMTSQSIYVQSSVVRPAVADQIKSRGGG